MTGCRIHLVRHGRTLLNAQGRFRGRADPPLNNEGRAEARRVALQLRAAALQGVYTSPLTRARQTAEEIASQHGLSLQVLPELTDLDYGAWTGRTPEEVAKSDGGLYQLFLSTPEEVTPPGGESIRTARSRVERVVHEIASAHCGDSVVVVTHEFPIRLVLASARRLHGAAFWWPHIPTGSLTEILVGPSGIDLVSQ